MPMGYLMANMRTTDLRFRYGRDEFVLILQGIDEARGPTLVDSLLENVCTEPIPGDLPISICFSAGLSYYPNDGDTSDMLLKAPTREFISRNVVGAGTLPVLKFNKFLVISSRGNIILLYFILLTSTLVE